MSQLQRVSHPQARDGSAGDLVATTVPRQDLHRIYAEFVSLAEEEGDRQGFLMALLQRVVAFTGSPGGVYFVRDDDGDLAFGPRLLSRELVQAHPQIQSQLAEAARRAVRGRSAAVELLDDDGRTRLLTLPVSGRDGAAEVFSLVVEKANVEPLLAILQLAAGYVNFHAKTRVAQQLDEEAGASAALVELLGRVAGAEDLEQAGVVLANELARELKAARVAVGVVSGSGQLGLRAISDTSRFDRRNALTHAIEGVFSESAGIGEAIAWPAGDHHGHGMTAHQRLQNQCAAVTLASAPLHDADGQLAGAVVAWWLEDVDMARATRLLGALDRPLGAILATQRHVRRRSRGGRGAWLVAAALVACVALLWMPVTHRVDAGVLIQPQAQRVVTAPFSGIVEESSARVGDLVAGGDLLARFDGREFRWRLDELQAEHERLDKKRIIALADGKTIDAQLSALEMRRAALQIDLLQSRIDRLEVRAPIDGVVLGDALEQRQGGPVEKGQALFEIAPIEQLNAEIEVPVADISHVAPGLPMTFQVDAFPDRQWSIAMGELLPRAEVRDDESVFVSKVALAGDSDGLLPGMRGSASIEAGRRALGWVLFHRPVEHLRRALGWLSEDGDAGAVAAIEAQRLEPVAAGETTPTAWQRLWRMLRERYDSATPTGPEDLSVRNRPGSEP